MLYRLHAVYNLVTFHEISSVVTVVIYKEWNLLTLRRFKWGPNGPQRHISMCMRDMESSRQNLFKLIRGQYVMNKMT